MAALNPNPMEAPMAEAVYILCAALSASCAFILFRGYRRSLSKLLLWSSLCFGMLALSNGVLVLDMVIFPEIDFGGGFFRSLFGALAGSVLLFGLIWELT
jgi:hypothetical protein